jgi:hypothetical protein
LWASCTQGKKTERLCEGKTFFTEKRGEIRNGDVKENIGKNGQNIDKY